MLIATWNVNSILVRTPNVLRWLDLVKPDVLCMQETKCTDDKFPTLLFQERGYQCQLFGQQAYNGVAILTREACDTSHRGYPGDDESAQSRLITTCVNGINIVNVYIPNGQAVGSEKYAFKLAWMQRLREFFDTTTIRKRRCCCVATSMSLPKSATCTTFGYGRDASCSANRNAARWSI